MQIGLLTF